MFHIYRSGVGFHGLRLLSGLGLHVLHINDYPAEPPQETITDAHRVFPGDGIAPLTTILRDLYAAGFRGALSLELFNRDYWKQTPQWVAQTGLEKTLRRRPPGVRGTTGLIPPDATKPWGSAYMRLGTREQVPPARPV